MTYTQLVSPNLDTVDGAGWCLRFVSSAYGISTAGYMSATEAADASDITRDALPDVAVPVWFHHYGTYGTPAVYADWGHVVIFVPGRGFLSSPLNGVGQLWLDSIEAVERSFNSTYRGWSLDLAGTPVATSTPTPLPGKKGKDMYTITNSSTKKTYTVGNQFIKHEQDGTRAAIVANITMGSASTVPQLDQWSFDVVCDSMGIPRGTANTLPSGGTWSRQQDILKVL